MASQAGFNPSGVSVGVADVTSFTLLRTVCVGLVGRISVGISRLGFVVDFWPAS